MSNAQMPPCGAMTSHGLPCKRKCVPGMTRCNLHGGHSPAAKIKSEQMLAQARLPACEALFDIIDRWASDRCVTCGFPSGDTDTTKVIIRAAQVILDRSGMGPRSTVETIPQRDGDLDLETLTDQEMALLDYHLGEIKKLKAAVRERLTALVHGETAAPPEETTH